MKAEPRMLHQFVASVVKKARTFVVASVVDAFVAPPSIASPDAGKIWSVFAPRFAMTTNIPAAADGSVTVSFVPAT